MLRIYGLGLGYSQSFERLSVILPRVKIASFSAGLPVGPLYLGYSHIVMSSSVNKNNTNIYGIRWIGDRFTLHAGVKVQKDHRNATDSWIRGGIQRKLGSRIGVGYDFGQYRQSHSASLQIYL